MADQELQNLTAASALSGTDLLYVLQDPAGTPAGKKSTIDLMIELARTTILAGKAGGQTFKGGTASGEDLTLMSSAHATKGSILIGANFEYDEVNSKLNLGAPSNTQGRRSNAYDNVPAPSGIQTLHSDIIEGKGDNATAIGVSGRFIKVQDRSDVTASNKGALYGLQLSIAPIVARNNSPFDDAAGLIVQNAGTAKATDAIYVGRNAGIAGSEWFGAITLDVNADWALRANGAYSYGLDVSRATLTNEALRIPYNKGIAGLKADLSAYVPLIKLDGAENVSISEAGRQILMLGPLNIATDLAKPFLMIKSTVAISAPAAGNGLLRWEVGTNAGTLKLVAYSGTSTTGVTIVDNVGAGN